MHRRFAQKLLSITVFALAASAASAAPKDKAANAKIEEAIYEDYLATNFKKADQKLRGIIKACGKKCSKSVIAKAWMYVGIVRSTSGEPDAEGAFKKALQTDPRVKLDQDIASDDAREAWANAEASMGGGDGGGDDSGVVLSDDDDDDDDGGGGEGSSTECSPSVTEVERRRPIPVSCPADPDAKAGELRYKEFGSDRWQTVKMRKRRRQYQATIPCTATGIEGKIRYYVRTKDAQGDTIDEFGSRRAPFEIDIVRDTSEQAPAYPGRDAPDICEESVECPPGMPGCGPQECKGGFQSKGWGTSCDESCECEEGLGCINGSCETASGCTSDSDCGDGTCVDGKCEGADQPDEGGELKNWVGVQFAIDWAWLSGDNVCDPTNKNNAFTCFKRGTSDKYKGKPLSGPNTGNAIGGGFALATMRILASYDRLITPNIDLGARLGFAFRGGPAADNASFLPVHVEGRATWRFIPGGIINPYAGIAGGAAQVDAKKEIDVVTEGVGQEPLDAWKKVGTGFVAATGGFYYEFQREMALQVNLDLMYFFPSSGFVLEPSVGLVYGF